jgi:enoyl-CoA hydratase
MVQLIGKGKAMELLMTSDMIDAATAHHLGLVNDVTTCELLIEKCKTIINKIAAVSPVAVAGIVKCVDAYFEPGIDGFNFEAEEFGRCFAKDDVKEGVAAFLEKRKANFKR